jgi:hypothetical protein
LTEQKLAAQSVQFGVEKPLSTPRRFDKLIIQNGETGLGPIAVHLGLGPQPGTNRHPGADP